MAEASVATGRTAPLVEDDLADLLTILASCLRRIRTWRRPSHWSELDWRDEMEAEGMVAILQATSNFEPDRGVPLGAYVRMRIMGRLLTRYRDEWRYASHGAHGPWAERDDSAAAVDPTEASPDELKLALGQLKPIDRWLIEQLFWEGETETKVAGILGISQQAVSKRKHLIIRNLRRWLGDFERLRHPRFV